MIFHAVPSKLLIYFSFALYGFLEYSTGDFQSTVVTTAIRRAGTETDLNCNNFKFKHCLPG